MTLPEIHMLTKRSKGSVPVGVKLVDGRYIIDRESEASDEAMLYWMFMQDRLNGQSRKVYGAAKEGLPYRGPEAPPA